MLKAVSISLIGNYANMKVLSLGDNHNQPDKSSSSIGEINESPMKNIEKEDEHCASSCSSVEEHEEDIR